MKNLIIGDWKLHRDNLVNGHDKFTITDENIEQINSKFYIKGLNQQLKDMNLEVCAINERCMVLSEELVIYILLRNS